MSGSRIVIAANPFSGSSVQRRRVDQFISTLKQRGLIATALWGHDQWRPVIGEGRVPDDCRCVVAAGGDGTVSDVVNLRLPVPLAALPLGTENLFANQFGFTDDSVLADALAAGRTRRCDLMRANDRWVSLMTSVGFDADVAHRLDRWRFEHPRRVKHVTRLTYVPLIVQSLAAYEHPTIALRADGGEPITGSLALVSNLPQYGLGFKPIRAARGDDGWLDYLVWRGGGRVRLVSFMWSGQRGTLLRRRDVIRGRAKRVRITTPASTARAPAQADGEPLGHTPLDVALHPGALQVVDVR